jgi:hypothetical protein
MYTHVYSYDLPQSCRLWSLLAPSLYSDLEFYDHDWAPCLTALQTQPELIKQVQSLKLHTENFSNSRGYPLSRILADLVVRMPDLQTFVWDLPWAMDAGLWEALKPGVYIKGSYICVRCLTTALFDSQMS